MYPYHCTWQLVIDTSRAESRRNHLKILATLDCADWEPDVNLARPRVDRQTLAAPDFAQGARVVTYARAHSGRSRSSSPARKPSPPTSWPELSNHEEARAPAPALADDAAPPIPMGPGRTGVKGIIRDRDEVAARTRERRTQETAALARAMEKASVGGKTYLEDEREHQWQAGLGMVPPAFRHMGARSTVMSTIWSAIKVRQREQYCTRARHCTRGHSRYDSCDSCEALQGTRGDIELKMAAATTTESDVAEMIGRGSARLEAEGERETLKGTDPVRGRWFPRGSGYPEAARWLFIDLRMCDVGHSLWTELTPCAECGVNTRLVARSSQCAVLQLNRPLPLRISQMTESTPTPLSGIPSAMTFNVLGVERVKNNM
ncbi:hypothetical protein DENSPDRAFT_849985 [Dentipellis sp. KUC8613]|nr:hypothetical protein DENSPDRAFT_849985 [Dentipellis sp. KUC8613]